MGGEEQERVILQVLPDARQVDDDRDAEPLKIGRRSDPGAHQERGRVQRAGT